MSINVYLQQQIDFHPDKFGSLIWTEKLAYIFKSFTVIVTELGFSTRKTRKTLKNDSVPDKPDKPKNSLNFVSFQ